MVRPPCWKVKCQNECSGFFGRLSFGCQRCTEEKCETSAEEETEEDEEEEEEEDDSEDDSEDEELSESETDEENLAFFANVVADVPDEQGQQTESSQVSGSTPGPDL